MKICSKCKILKTLDLFGRDKSRKDGLTCQCKQCLNSKNKKWRLNNPNKVKIAQTKQRSTIKRRFKESQRRAQNKNLEWSISIEEFSELISKSCYYCNNLLGKKSVSNSGLDRMDNSKGYVIDNVCSCCHFCNKIKSDQLSVEEAIVAINAIIALRSK